MNREDFQKTVNHEKPARILVDFGGCPLSCADAPVLRRLGEFLGYSPKDAVCAENGIDERILLNYDIPVRGVGKIYAPKKSHYKTVDENTYVDEWGIVRKFTGLYWDIVESPLHGATEEEILKYEFPDPQSVDMREIDELKERVKKLYETTDYVICASHPTYGIFELGCWMFGFDDFLYRMAAEPEVVHAFFERVLDYQKQISEIYYGTIGQYIQYTSSGDDFATQQSAFFSKDMFDEMIFPYFKERIRFTKQLTGAKFLHHSCGNVFKLIPSLIEAGVDILNPIQPCQPEMSPASLKGAYGDKIVFHGGLDTQALLPKGDKAEIEQGIRNLLDVFRNDGGYIFAAAHNLQSDVDAETVNFMFETVKKLR